jgi:hypothetical protein
MLISLILTLTPESPATLPPDLGRAVRAETLARLGQVTYTALDDDRYGLAALNILADFALYSGVGVQTATGMGQCRRVDR